MTLMTSRDAHLSSLQTIPLRRQVKQNAIHRSFQSQTAHKKDNEDQVGEGGREVDSFALGFDATNQAETDKQPCPQQS